jgi:hypothetical protein
MRLSARILNGVGHVGRGRECGRDKRQRKKY